MQQVEVNPLDFLILVVDDFKPNVVLLTHVLESEGFRVSKCYDGDEALEKIKEEVPDLILLDINMPVMSGIEVGESLRRSEFEDIPIIFLSGSNDSIDKVKAFEAGAVDFVNKPFDKDELLMRLRNHLMIKVLRQESEEQVQILKEREIELSEVNQKKHKLMRMLSHDIKNPVSGIMGLVSILLEDDSLDEGEKEEMLELIQQSTEKLLNLVKDLLDKEVVGSEFESLSKESTNLVELIEEVVKNNKSKAALKKILLTIDYVEDKFLMELDSKKIKRVFNTLLSNAIKFTLSEGTVRIKLERSSSETILIKVMDTGIGIPNAMLPNFLISSQKEHTENPRGILGIGLGLEEVQSHIEAHDGSIWLESKENVGTTFFIELPLGN